MPIAGEDQRDIDLLDTTRAHRIGAVADAVAASTSAIAMGWIGRMYHLHHPSRMGGLMEIDGDVGGVRTVPPVRFAICWGRRLARGPTKWRARAIEVEDWP